MQWSRQWSSSIVESYGAIALTHDLVLITNDPAFERVPGLRKENWLA